MAIHLERPPRRVWTVLRTRLARLNRPAMIWEAYRPLPIYTAPPSSLVSFAALAENASMIGWRFIVQSGTEKLLVDIAALSDGPLGAGVVTPGGPADRLLAAATQAEIEAGDRSYRARILDLSFAGEEHLWLASLDSGEDMLLSVKTLARERPKAVMERATIRDRLPLDPATLRVAGADDLVGC